MTIKIPEVALIYERQQWMDVKEVLLEELIEHGSSGHAQTALKLKKVDVLRRNVGEVAHCEKRIVGIDNIGCQANLGFVGPGIVVTAGELVQ